MEGLRLQAQIECTEGERENKAPYTQRLLSSKGLRSCPVQVTAAEPRGELRAGRKLHPAQGRDFHEIRGFSG